eukprot:tig00000788_g4090.t1
MAESSSAAADIDVDADADAQSLSSSPSSTSVATSSSQSEAEDEDLNVDDIDRPAASSSTENLDRRPRPRPRLDGPSLDDLPDEILCRVFLFVGPFDAAGLCRLDSLSRRARRVVWELAEWSGSLDLWPPTAEVHLSAARARGALADTARLHLAAARRLLLWATAGRLRGLRSLRLAVAGRTHAQALVELLAMLQQSSPGIQRLEIRLCPLSVLPLGELGPAAPLLRAAQSLPSLSELILHEPELQADPEREPLVSLPLRPSPLGALDWADPDRVSSSLEVLSVPERLLDAGEVPAIARGAPALRSLRCRADQAGLFEIATWLRGLRSLRCRLQRAPRRDELQSFGPGLGRLGETCPELAVLRVGGRRSAALSDAEVEQAARVSALRELSLRVDDRHVRAARSLERLAALPALRALKVGADFRAGLHGAPRGELADSLAGDAAALLRRLRRLVAGAPEEEGGAPPPLHELKVDLGFELNRDTEEEAVALLSACAAQGCLVSWRRRDAVAPAAPRPRPDRARSVHARTPHAAAAAWEFKALARGLAVRPQTGRLGQALAEAAGPRTRRVHVTVEVPLSDSAVDFLLPFAALHAREGGLGPRPQLAVRVLPKPGMPEEDVEALRQVRVRPGRRLSFS